MSILESIAKAFLGDPSLHTRSDNPELDRKIQALWQRHTSSRAWREPGVNEALGVPAIFSAVSLIANTVGSLSLEGFRLGQLLTDQSQIPRIIIRPNPFSTPRVFFRDTAFYLATRGEAWWWVAARDIDGVALSLYPVPPWEITVEANERNRLRPTIKWANRTIPNEDIRQITYLSDANTGRGVGPLQMCGAAVSVTVEAQEWAANFYSGSVPSVIGTTDQDMTEDELKAMDAQWNEKPPNLPRWLTNGLTLSESPVDPEKAQLTEARQHQVGEAARMFSMPGALIEYQMSGSSVTYQNQADIWNDFQRRCLSPHYLEPIEQEMSDLLTRATVARFNLDQLLRADIKSRYETWKVGIESGFMTPDEARQKEGFAPGSVDFQPVPVALPQAIPTLLPVNRARSALVDLHCPRCGRMAGRVNGAAEIKCQRCGEMVKAA